MPRYLKTSDELFMELREQLEALRSSIRAFDSGYTWEAKRLATSVYTLVHTAPKGRTKSLLSQLKLRSKARWISSIAQPATGRKHLQFDVANTLVVIRTSGSDAKFAPKLDAYKDTYRYMPFDDWYEERIFCGFDTNASVSRKNLIHYLRSQDGGAHVDASITSEGYLNWKMIGHPTVRYERNEHGGTDVYGAIVDIYTGQVIEDIKSGKPIPGAVSSAMRQVAWELNDYADRLEL